MLRPIHQAEEKEEDQGKWTKVAAAEGRDADGEDLGEGDRQVMKKDPMSRIRKVSNKFGCEVTENEQLKKKVDTLGGLEGN